MPLPNSDIPKVILQGTAADDVILEKIADMVVKRLRDGMKQVQRYRNAHELPIGIGGYIENMVDDQYCVVMVGIVCRPPDAERYFNEELRPAFLGAVDLITRTFGDDDARGTKET